MTDKKEIKDRLKILRNLCNLSQTKFVNIASIKIDTYKSWEIGKRIPSANALQKCIEVFRSYGIDTSIEWLLTGSGTNPTYKIKLDDNNQDTKNKIQVSNPVEELMFLQSHYKNFESFILNDNSMMPYFEPGDIVGGEKIEKFEIQNLFNQNCIFQLKDNRKLFRKLTHYGTTIYLVPVNTISGYEIITDPQIEWIAPVFWHRKKID